MSRQWFGPGAVLVLHPPKARPELPYPPTGRSPTAAHCYDSGTVHADRSRQHRISLEIHKSISGCQREAPVRSASRGSQPELIPNTFCMLPITPKLSTPSSRTQHSRQSSPVVGWVITQLSFDFSSLICGHFSQPLLQGHWNRRKHWSERTSELR